MNTLPTPNVSAGGLTQLKGTSLAHLAVCRGGRRRSKIPRRQLTPYTGGLGVQLANKIKQDEAEIAPGERRVTLAEAVKESGRSL